MRRRYQNYQRLRRRLRRSRAQRHCTLKVQYRDRRQAEDAVPERMAQVVYINGIGPREWRTWQRKVHRGASGTSPQGEATPANRGRRE